MTLIDSTAPEVPQAGNFLLLFVPEGGLADPTAPTLAELTAPTVKPITYAHKKGGYTTSKETARLKDERLTKKNVRETRGETTHGLEGTFAFGSDADALIVEEVKGYIVERWAIPIETPLTAAQKVDVKEITDCEVFKMPPTGDAGFTKRYRAFLGEVYEDVAIAA